MSAASCDRAANTVGNKQRKIFRALKEINMTFCCNKNFETY